MAKRKTKTAKREPSKARPQASRRWRITLIKGTPAKFIGYVDAPDERSAIAAAVKEFKISDALRNRLVVLRQK